jgi:hypothetical protein
MDLITDIEEGAEANDGTRVTFQYPNSEVMYYDVIESAEDIDKKIESEIRRYYHREGDLAYRGRPS